MGREGVEEASVRARRLERRGGIRRAPERVHWPSAVAAVLASLGAGALLAAPAAVPEPATAPQTAEVHRRLIAMDTVLDVRVEAPDRRAALAASEAAVRAIEAVEAELSVWRDDTPLSRLNRSPVGAAVELPAAVVASLERVLACGRRTAGGFDPALGASGGRAAFSIASPVSVVREAPAPLDSGGFAKGEALDRAVEALRGTAALSASLDLGGQLVHYSRAAGASWEVDVADSDARRRAAFRLSVGSGSVATSAQGERGAHIVDPETGRAAAGFGSLTVVVGAGVVGAGESSHPGFWADCLATGLFVAGPREALTLADAIPGVEAALLTRGEDGLVATVTAGLAGRIQPRAEGSRVIVHHPGAVAPAAAVASTSGE